MVVSDQMTDGCWTNVYLVNQKIRLIFEQSSIAVHETDILNNPFFPLVIISTNGFKVGGKCIGNTEFELSLEMYHDWKSSSTDNTYFLGGFVVHG